MNIKLATILLSLTISASSYALSCNERNWDRTMDIEEEMFDLYDAGIEIHEDACTYSFSIRSWNYRQTISDINRRLTKASDAISEYKMSRKKLVIVKERWSSLSRSCSGKDSDTAYDNYKLQRDWGKINLWNDDDTDVVDKAIKCKTKLKKIRRDVEGYIKEQEEAKKAARY